MKMSPMNHPVRRTVYLAKVGIQPRPTNELAILPAPDQDIVRLSHVLLQVRPESELEEQASGIWRDLDSRADLIHGQSDWIW